MIVWWFSLFFLERRTIVGGLIPAEPEEAIQNIVEMSDLDQNQRASIIQVQFPNVVTLYKPNVRIPDKLFTKMKKKSLFSKEETKSGHLRFRDDNPHENIFCCYSDSSGRNPTTIIDLREISDNSESWNETTVETMDKTQKMFPADLYEDAYNGTKPYLMMKIKRNQLPLWIVNPEYFIPEKNENITRRNLLGNHQSFYKLNLKKWKIFNLSVQ